MINIIIGVALVSAGITLARKRKQKYQVIGVALFAAGAWLIIQGLVVSR